MNFSSWLIKKLMRYPEDDSDMHSIVVIVIKVEIAISCLSELPQLMLGATKSDNHVVILNLVAIHKTCFTMSLSDFLTLNDVNISQHISDFPDDQPACMQCMHLLMSLISACNSYVRTVSYSKTIMQQTSQLSQVFAMYITNYITCQVATDVVCLHVQSQNKTSCLF